NAEHHHREGMIKSNKTFFVPWDTIDESNPREIIERKEKINFVPYLIMQGGLDDNMLPAAQENFVKLYKAAGGQVEFHLFEKSVHEWVAEESPETDKARATVKEFIARQLKG
ncbi:MAG TPA: prolyl oligopeptidase family serine peptidase, partial [Stellaceae bacterium]|nr:prolyl oligopeptidase family serine peptidase [Stellaceae bacterium]